MNTPNYLLWIETVGEEPGEWRFVLQSATEAGEPMDVELDIVDVEPEVQGERLELLTVVRGLEALDQASRVTVVTASRYVRIGLERHLAQWRAKGWMWESFGRMETVKHADLWRRLDQASLIHEIHCVTPALMSQRDREGADEPCVAVAVGAAPQEIGTESPRTVSVASPAVAARRRVDPSHDRVPRQSTAARAGLRLWGLMRKLAVGS